MSKVPKWLYNLFTNVANCMESHNAPSPLDFRYFQESGQTNVMIYPMPVELVGGEYDGVIVLPGFYLDIKSVISIFDQIDELDWCSQSVGLSDEGAYISVEGIYDGHRVWLQIMAEAPKDEEPGMQLDVSGAGGAKGK